MKNVYLFLAADTIRTIPDGQLDTWGNYEEPDLWRMFLVCAKSWERHGWKVNRFKADMKAPGRFTSFRSPVLRRSIEQGYTLKYWNQWFAIVELFRQTGEKWLWFTTNDVLNNFLTVKQSVGYECLADSERAYFINCETERHSHAVFACRVEYAIAMIETIQRVDVGDIHPDTTISLVSDESIARDCLKVMDFHARCCKIGFDYGYPLNHIARSILKPIETDYPLIEV